VRQEPNAEITPTTACGAALTGLGRFASVTVCERVTDEPRRIDTTARVVHLATAYLARKQPRGRVRGTEFTSSQERGARLHPDRRIPTSPTASGGGARAVPQGEKCCARRPTIRSSCRSGWQDLPAATGVVGTGATSRSRIDKLSSGFRHPAARLALELGGAYRRPPGRQGRALTERLLAGPDLAKAPPESAAALRARRKAQFTSTSSRRRARRFEAARELRPTDITIQRNLVLTIRAGIEPQDPRAAVALLDQALSIDPQSRDHHQLAVP